MRAPGCYREKTVATDGGAPSRRSRRLQVPPSAVAKAMVQVAHSERGERVVCSHDDGSGGVISAQCWIYCRLTHRRVILISAEAEKHTAQKLTINSRTSNNIYCTSTNEALEKKHAAGGSRPPSRSNIGNTKVQSVFKRSQLVPFNLLTFFLFYSCP